MAPCAPQQEASMGIALTLQSYFGDHRIAYDVTKHDRTSNSSHTAERCHVPGERLAKGVVLKSAAGYVLAVLPSSKRGGIGAGGKGKGPPAARPAETQARMLF